MSRLRLATFISKGIQFSFLTAFFIFQGCLRLFKGRGEAAKKGAWMSFVPSLSPTTKFRVKMNNENKTISCLLLLFLIFPWKCKGNNWYYMQIFWCSKLLKYYSKKGQIIRGFLFFLVPYVRFLFESLKLIKQIFPRFNQISRCSKLLKYFNIFQEFLPSLKFFLLHTNVPYFSTLHQKRFFSWPKT